MTRQLSLIGFGEAGQKFADGACWTARAYDRETDAPARRDGKWRDYARVGVTGCETNAEALTDAPLVLSLVTAERALVAARLGAAHLAPGALWCDMNSVSPATKCAAAAAIHAAGGRYADCAIMASVTPGGRATPLLVSGPHADEAVAALVAAGFSGVRPIAGDIGAAAAIKMIRSVMVKGLEALTAECLVAAHRAGVVDEVLASLGDGSASRADYNLDRMLAHGVRRAAELEEVAATLEALGVAPLMSRAAATRQRALGALGSGTPPGLADKLELLADGA